MGAYMTPAAALHAFWAGFGLEAYEENSIPAGAEKPYLTYTQLLDYWPSEGVVQVNLWFRGESNVAPNAAANAIGDAVGMGGALVECDGGAIWITRGSPFCQSMSDYSDATIKRRYMVFNAKFLNE